MKTKIFEICDKLQAQGIKPTLERVRDALGGGSFSTINPILKDWKEQQTASEQIAVELPAEAIQAAQQATAIIWKLAAEKHAELITAMQHDFDKSLKEALAEKEEALTEVARLEQDATKLQEENQVQAKENAALMLNFQKIQLELEVAAREVESLKAQVKEEREAAKLSAEKAAELKGQLSVFEAMKKEAKTTAKKM